ncbi:Uncharacterised protein [Chlamydia trachomatis]|nr:Uncharacterised protein [Chlamydia trachomatis]
MALAPTAVAVPATSSSALVAVFAKELVAEVAALAVSLVKAADFNPPKLFEADKIPPPTETANPTMFVIPEIKLC